MWDGFANAILLHQPDDCLFSSIGHPPHINTKLESQAHTVVVVAVSHRVVVTVRYAAVSSVVVPATTAQHAVRSTFLDNHPNIFIHSFLYFHDCACIAKAISGTI